LILGVALESKFANLKSQIPHTPWCNGNTAPFGGVILGSNPSGVATLSNRDLPMKTGSQSVANGRAQKRTKTPPIRQVFVKYLVALSADFGCGRLECGPLIASADCK
jgi:hypothetical protein